MHDNPLPEKRWLSLSKPATARPIITALDKLDHR